MYDKSLGTQRGLLSTRLELDDLAAKQNLNIDQPKSILTEKGRDTNAK